MKKLPLKLPELQVASYTLYAVFEKNNQPSSYAQSVLKLLSQHEAR